MKTYEVKLKNGVVYEIEADAANMVNGLLLFVERNFPDNADLETILNATSTLVRAFPFDQISDYGDKKKVGSVHVTKAASTGVESNRQLTQSLTALKAVKDSLQIHRTDDPKSPYFCIANNLDQKACKLVLEALCE